MGIPTQYISSRPVCESQPAGDAGCTGGHPAQLRLCGPTPPGSEVVAHCRHQGTPPPNVAGKTGDGAKPGRQVYDSAGLGLLFRVSRQSRLDD